MGYIFVVITVIMNVTKGFCSKKISRNLKDFCDNVNVNILRNVLCTVFGVAFVFLMGHGNLGMPSEGFIICALSGALTAASYIVWLKALRTGVYMFASAANNSGFIIAVFCGVFLFGERLTIFKAFAIILILAALYFMTLYQTSFGTKPSLSDVLVLLGVFVTSGLSSVIQKQFTRVLPETSVHLYTLYTFAFSVIILLIFRPFVKSRASASEQAVKLKVLFPMIVVMGLTLYGATYFQTLAASGLDAVVVYPLTNGLNLIGASLMAWAAFGEKPNRYSIIGAFLVFAALVLSRF